MDFCCVSTHTNAVRWLVLTWRTTPVGHGDMLCSAEHASPGAQRQATLNDSGIDDQFLKSFRGEPTFGENNIGMQEKNL